MASRPDNTSYPKEDNLRIKFWAHQISMGQDWVAPYMKAGARVVKLYNNIPHNLREKDLEDTGPENVQRVKGSLVFAWVDQSKANMLNHSPEFSITPETSASVGGVDIVQRVSNYWYDYTKQIEEDEQMALNGFLLPYAVKKLGWSAVIEQQQEVYLTDAGATVIDDPDADNRALFEGTLTRPTIWQDHDVHIEAHLALIQTPQIHPEVVSIVEEHIDHHKELMNMEQPQMDSRVRWESPFGSSWQPDDFVMDAFSSMNMRTARFIAWRIRAPLYWWKRQTAFKNTDELRANRKLSIHQDGLPFKANEHDSVFEEFAMVEGWEIWALDFPVRPGEYRNLLITYVEGQEKIQRHDEEWPYRYLNDYPGVLMKFQDNVKTWINKPTLALAGADNIQGLVNEFFDSALYTLRKSKNLWLYDTNLMTKEEFQNLLSAPDSSSYGVAGLADHKERAVQPLPFFDVQQDKMNYLTMLLNYLDRTAGTPTPMRGRDPETATEAAIIERKNSAREDSRIKRFEHMQIETAEKFWQLHQQFQPDREFLIDPRLGVFKSVTEEIAKGQFRFRIDISPRSQARAVERKNWLDLFNILVGSIPAHLNLGLQPPNIVKALELLLRRGFDIRDPENLLPASESQFHQQMKELMDKPEEIPKVIEAFRALSGGGDFGPLGGNQSLNPQQLGQKPQNETAQSNGAPAGVKG